MHTLTPARPLTFRAYHTKQGAQAAERLRVNPNSEGQLPNSSELLSLLLERFALADPLQAQASRSDEPARRDPETTWMLRNVTRSKFLDGELQHEIEDDDVLEVMDRSVAGWGRP